MKISQHKTTTDWSAVIDIPLTRGILEAMCFKPEDYELGDPGGRPYRVVNVKDWADQLHVIISAEPCPSEKVFGWIPPQHLIRLPFYLSGDIAVALAKSALEHGIQQGINQEREARKAAQTPKVTPLADTVGDHREPDHHTSVASAYANPGHRSSQRVRIGWAYYRYPDGLTDEEASDYANIPFRACPWKRCGELREPGRMYLEYTGKDRLTQSGQFAKVWRMTAGGRDAWRKFMGEDPMDYVGVAPLKPARPFSDDLFNDDETQRAEALIGAR